MRESSSESDSRGGTPDDKKPTEIETGGEKATKKAGSKEKGRKRTKTGCLSELISLLDFLVFFMSNLVTNT